MHRLQIAGIADNDITDATTEIIEIVGKAENSHDFGGDGDIETTLTRSTVKRTAKGNDDVAQGTVIHIHDALPGDPARVETGFVFPVNMVIDQCRQQVMRRTDSMEVAGEMQVDFLHRHNLSVTTTRGATLHTETGSQARFAQTHDCFLANGVKPVTQANRSRGFAFTCRSWRDRGNQDQFAILVSFHRVDKLGGQFRFIMSERLDCCGWNIERLRDFGDRFQSCFTCNFDIAFCHFFLQIVEINCTVRSRTPKYLKADKLMACRI